MGMVALIARTASTKSRIYGSTGSYKHKSALLKMYVPVQKWYTL